MGISSTIYIFKHSFDRVLEKFSKFLTTITFSIMSIKTNIVRKGYYFIDVLENSLGCVFQYNDYKKIMYHQFRGYMLQYYNPYDMQCFINIVLMNFLHIEIVNLEDWLEQFNIKKCEVDVMLRKNNSNAFKTINYQKLYHCKNSNSIELVNFDVLEVNHCESDDEMTVLPPIIACDYSLDELKSRLNLNKFVQYITERHGKGIAEQISYQILNSFNRVSNILYIDKLFSNFEELLENIIPSAYDYLIYNSIVEYICKSMNIERRKPTEFKNKKPLPKLKYIKFIYGESIIDN